MTPEQYWYLHSRRKKELDAKKMANHILPYPVNYSWYKLVRMRHVSMFWFLPLHHVYLPYSFALPKIAEKIVLKSFLPT